MFVCSQAVWTLLANTRSATDAVQCQRGKSAIRRSAVVERGSALSNPVCAAHGTCPSHADDEDAQIQDSSSFADVKCEVVDAVSLPIDDLLTGSEYLYASVTSM